MISLTGALWVCVCLASVTRVTALTHISITPASVKHSVRAQSRACLSHRWTFNSLSSFWKIENGLFLHLKSKATLFLDLDSQSMKSVELQSFAVVKLVFSEAVSGCNIPVFWCVGASVNLSECCFLNEYLMCIFLNEYLMCIFLNEYLMCIFLNEYLMCWTSSA